MAPEDPKPDVLSSLPRSRPQRRSAKRDAPKPAAKKAPAARKPAPKPRKAPKPRVHAAPRRIPPAGFEPPRDAEDRPAPSGVELVGTAIQAAGELAQIGLAVGGQALRSALGRISR